MNKALARVEQRLGGRTLSKIDQTLFVEAIQPWAGAARGAAGALPYPLLVGPWRYGPLACAPSVITLFLPSS